jgi:hypothetical protein
VVDLRAICHDPLFRLGQALQSASLMHASPPQEPLIGGRPKIMPTARPLIASKTIAKLRMNVPMSISSCQNVIGKIASDNFRKYRVIADQEQCWYPMTICKF